MDERLCWLGLSLTPGIGTRRLRRLLDAFQGPDAIWSASRGDLLAAGLDATTTDNLLRSRASLDLESVFKRLDTLGARLIVQTDSDYPAAMRPLPDAPPVLYARGALIPADEKAVAIVGTRKATGYGRDVARRLAGELASAGVTIVSGLAHGIDAIAHQAAMEAGGRTIAVLGCGIDQVYPRDHAALARQISEHGAVLTEFPLGSQPEGRHFPRRNRIISGISLGVIIVEAPEKSGALITAAFALEQGREIYAVPGSIFSAASTGCHRLIQDGARIVVEVNDILDDLSITSEQIMTRAAVQETLPLTAAQVAVLRAFGSEPVHVDVVVRTVGMAASAVISALTSLELQGYVEQDRASLYRLNYAAQHLLRELDWHQ
ncbi:MAG: DNA-protecting protein DprA [Chloroflexi bacterium]|nr:DNA-protecting protein DprA [Chloroflexota bacterium]